VPLNLVCLLLRFIASSFLRAFEIWNPRFDKGIAYCVVVIRMSLRLDYSIDSLLICKLCYGVDIFYPSINYCSSISFLYIDRLKLEGCGSVELDCLVM